MKKKKTIKNKKIQKNTPRKTKARKDICDRYQEDEMCYKCLDLSRELLLSGELDPEELKRVKRIMNDIISKRGIPKDEVFFLNKLSEAYLS